jgi:hypothetical protein
MFRAAFTSALSAKPQAVHTKGAWLWRDFASTCPHAEQRWLVNAGFIFSTRPGALSSSRRTSRPQPDRMISRFSPAFWRMLLPGVAGRPPGRARHVPDLEVLDPDQVESARDIGGGFLGPVFARICLAGA